MVRPVLTTASVPPIYFCETLSDDEAPPLPHDAQAVQQSRKVVINENRMILYTTGRSRYVEYMVYVLQIAVPDALALSFVDIPTMRMAIPSNEN